MHSLKIILLLFVALVFSSCDSFVDDQSLLSEEQYLIVNPVPIIRDFELNNSRHKVIVAILDSGFDYNHPYLKNNIHFTLDEDGMPTGAGWDFTGNDPWPAPYLGRTDYKNLGLPQKTRDESYEEYQAFQILTKLYPELETVFSPERQHQEELDETIGHGTHVAGLASYDSPEIGLRGYRILPFNRGSEVDTKIAFDVFSRTILLGIQRAIDDGAQVLNMSLGVLSNSVDDEFRKFQNDLIIIAKNNPHVFFVVAAGNEGMLLDGKKSLSLPCYIPSKNVICVSALDENLLPADFSNILVNKDVTTIYAWGDEVLSTVPTQLCTSKNIDLSVLKSSPEDFANLILKDCTNPPLLKKMSGTSMASPIVARKIAKLLARYPELDIEGIKARLFNETIQGTFEGIEILKLPIEKPRWYNNLKLKSESPDSKMWSFVIPN